MGKKLSPREIEVLRLLSHGYQYKQVAKELWISHNTVKNHLQSIFEKLDVHSTVHAVARALRKGIID